MSTPAIVAYAIAGFPDKRSGLSHEQLLPYAGAWGWVALGTAALSIAEVPPLPQQMLEAMPFKFRATVRTVGALAVGHSGCTLETKFDVSLEKVESLRNSRVPRIVKLEGIGNEFERGCVGGSHAKILGQLRPGDEIVVYAEAPDDKGILHINHRPQIILNPQ